MLKYAVFVAATLATGPVSAQIEPGGTLNPEEMTVNRVMENIRMGKTDMATCAAGYFITKAGRHKLARELFEVCARAGYTGSMTWMSQMENNGLGASENPDAAADWDKRAAEAGDPIGKFNHGINLMRGHGTARNEALGRRMIDEAAREGLAPAQVFRDSGYDFDVVTPDADNWKYAPLF
ncbi:tetratricopeptide repeat protein [Hoeflea sp. TYP-13]|uniref:tetratricopeptide repeat protein n=1 Tax=Hoeflea sp. TYP-13 TaxID=3230023 RepID=UPI0034C695B3